MYESNLKTIKEVLKDMTLPNFLEVVSDAIYQEGLERRDACEHMAADIHKQVTKRVLSIIEFLKEE